VTLLRTPSRAPWFASAKAALIALIAIGGFGGCFVSFDDYRLGQAGAAGELAQGGVGGQRAAVNASAGRSVGGDAGTREPMIAEGGVPDMPDQSAGTGGAATATAGVGGATAGAAGRGSAGAAAGSGGTAASGGAAAGSGGTAASGGANGNAGAGGSNSGGSGGSATQYICPTVHGRISVAIPRSGSPSIYCIDRSEVKNVEYQAFLDSVASTAGQSSACTFNTNFAPDTAGGCNQYDPVGKANLPVACVDWCDAAAYCKWEGKRLCGRVDGGGSNPPSSFADASKSAWYRACSHAGDFDLPYGNVYSGEKCVGLDNTAIHPLAVPHTDCEGGYSGLYDMSGNVAEWEDSCAADAAASDQCLIRGGSYLDTNQSVGSSPSLLCNSNVHGSPLAATKARSTRDKEIGFRCCSDAQASP